MCRVSIYYVHWSSTTRHAPKIAGHSSNRICRDIKSNKPLPNIKSNARKANSESSQKLQYLEALLSASYANAE